MSCRAILFDLDGVLVDSRECIELIWHAWAAERGLDPADFLRVAHGRRIAETLRLVARRLGVAPADCVVVEDSPPGVGAGKAAGMRVIAVLTTYPAAALMGAEVRLDALAALRVRPAAPGSAGLTLDF